MTFLSGITSGLAWFLVRYAGVVAMFYLLSTVSEVAGFAARVLASCLAVVLASLFGVVASVVLRLSGGNRWQSSQWATGRAFKYAMAAMTGVVFAVEDPKHVLATTRPAVFVGNHQTAVDLLMLGSMFPRYCSVTAKRSLRSYPFLGWFMRLSGAIFIDRANSKDARSAMRGAADAIRTQRQSVYMFPEGTRSGAQEPMLLPFKKGAFHLAVQAGVPIVPVVAANYSYLYSTSKLRFHSGRVPIRGLSLLSLLSFVSVLLVSACRLTSAHPVLDPIPTEGLTSDDVADLTERVRDAMLKALVSLTAEARAAASSSKTPVAVPAAAAASDKAASSGVSS